VRAKAARAVTLDSLYNHAAQHRSELIRGSAARAVLSPSVTRVLAKLNRDTVLRWLADLNLQVLARIRSQEEYKRWFLRKADRLAAEARLSEEFLKKRRDKSRGKDPRWGHAAKILCLFVREAVVFRRALDDRAARAIEPFLYVPIDSEVIKRARKCKMRLKCKAIYEVGADAFLEFQNGSSPGTW